MDGSRHRYSCYPSILANEPSNSLLDRTLSKKRAIHHGPVGRFTVRWRYWSNLSRPPWVVKLSLNIWPSIFIVVCTRVRMCAHTNTPDRRGICVYASTDFGPRGKETRETDRRTRYGSLRSAKNIRRNKLKGDVHRRVSTTFLAVLLPLFELLCFLLTDHTVPQDYVPQCLRYSRATIN